MIGNGTQSDCFSIKLGPFGNFLGIPGCLESRLSFNLRNYYCQAVSHLIAIPPSSLKIAEIDGKVFDGIQTFGHMPLLCGIRLRVTFRIGTADYQVVKSPLE